MTQAEATAAAQAVQAVPDMVAAMKRVIAFGLTGDINIDGAALGALKGELMKALMEGGLE